MSRGILICGVRNALVVRATCAAPVCAEEENRFLVDFSH